MLGIRYSCQNLKKEKGFAWQNLEKSSNIIFVKIRQVRAEFFHAERNTDERTYRLS
jgi:hypothetical protein